MNFAKLYPPLSFVFSHTPRDFIVKEIPLYAFSQDGEHLILYIRKKNLNTLDLVLNISKLLGIQIKQIGYAGLKDKNALTYQHISIPKKYEKDIGLIENEDVKIIDTFTHKNKLKIGHLKGNNFFITLKKVNDFVANRIEEEANKGVKFGFANYFGFQRFGNFGDNHNLALKIKNKPLKLQSKKEKLLISSLQSFFFNNWLDARMQISSIISSLSIKESSLALKELGLNLDSSYIKILKDFPIPFKPLLGDVMLHYPHGRTFLLEDFKDLDRFLNKQISISGLLDGNSDFIMKPNLEASIIEERFKIKEGVQAIGTRRYAYVFPSDLECKYLKQEARFTLCFSLPSGSYATSFLEFIKNGKL